MKTGKKGFTLTEILLAIMIVGIIGVALAALTTAATRESGRGRSKIIMRDNLSLLMRQLRQDMHEANQVLFARGAMASTSGTRSLLLLAKNSVLENGASLPSQTPTYILYCFEKGNIKTRADGESLVPTGLSNDAQTTDGGIITRRELDAHPTVATDGSPACSSGGTQTMQVPNVKFISSSHLLNYPVPLFSVNSGNTVFNANAVGDDLGANLKVRLIVEAPTVPVLNDAVEEVISLRSGFEY